MSIQGSSTVAGQSPTAVVDPIAEWAYWKANYAKRGYVERDRPYGDYEPAYQHGWESRARLGSKPFREVESELERTWDDAKGESKLVWSQARHAVSDGWHRAGRPGVSQPTRDGG